MTDFTFDDNDAVYGFQPAFFVDTEANLRHRFHLDLVRHTHNPAPAKRVSLVARETAIRADVAAAAEWMDLHLDELHYVEDETIDWLDTIDPELDPSMMLGAISTHADSLRDAVQYLDHYDPHGRIDQPRTVVARPAPERQGHWQEPPTCKCTRYARWDFLSDAERTIVAVPPVGDSKWCQMWTPHKTKAPWCQRCRIEHFATARRSFEPGQDQDDPGRWVFNPHGEHGAFFQSSELAGLRAHACILPRRDGGKIALCVISEHEADVPYSFTKGGRIHSATKHTRTIIGFQECYSIEEAELLAREISDQWETQHEHRAAGFDSWEPGSLWSWYDAEMESGTFRKMGPATLSPELIERVADAPSGHTAPRHTSEG